MQPQTPPTPYYQQQQQPPPLPQYQQPPAPSCYQQQPSYVQKAPKLKRRGNVPWVIIGVLVVLLIIVGGIFAIIKMGLGVPWQLAPGNTIVWSVPEGQFGAETEEEIQEAVYENKALVSLAEQYAEQFNWNLNIVNLEIDGDWASLDASLIDRESSEVVGIGPLPLIGHKVNDHWEVVSPKDQEFFQLLPSIPDTLVPLDAKEFLIQWYGEGE